ncbi:hypothetical protein [Novipirellula sp.]|uniref:hypothetical protein n=1 Tax=Novipirellula sp. TaxID=2795430 RepID=UPI00356381A6
MATATFRSPISEENTTPQPPIHCLEHTDAWTNNWAPLIEQARWAPSGDNGQPWRIKPGSNPNVASLVLDNSQPLGFLDFNGEASRVAIGAFLENLRLAASQCERVIEIINISDTADDALSIELNLANVPRLSPDPLAVHIQDRHSNRKRQERAPLASYLLEKMQEQGNCVDGTHTLFSSDRPTIQKIAHAVSLADRVRFMHKQCHKEFYQKICWTNQETEVGFSVDTFEISRLEKLALQVTSNYQTLRLADQFFRMSYLAARAAKKQVIHSSAVGAIVGNPNMENFWLNVGSGLQRVWLQSASFDLGFQVLAVAPILSRQFRVAGSKRFNSWELNTLARVNALQEKFFNTSDDVAIMFRVGHTSPASARAGRRPWHQMIEPR